MPETAPTGPERKQALEAEKLQLLSTLRQARDTVQTQIQGLQQTLTANSDPEKWIDDDAFDRAYTTQLLNEARGMEQAVSGTSPGDQGSLANSVTRYREAAKNLEACLIDLDTTE